ncbi:MAG: transketolase [Ignavibacteriales bacterium]|nr:transketolase [Ignavibacteriales bacterium]
MEDELKEIALRARRHILDMTEGGCFLGASYSCVDIILFLYKKFLNVDSAHLKDPTRDYFFLSKGHSVPALYATFVELGWLEKERLKNHLKTNDDIYWHPNTKINGVEFHSGSLGHLLSVAVGVALDCKIEQRNNKVVVLLGDGELNEGSNWESLLIASTFKLNNLLIIIDRNKIQANKITEELIPLEPLKEKFNSFGFYVDSVNGHDFNDMDIKLKKYPNEDKPTILIAETVRGKGIPSIEMKTDKWFCKFTDDEINNYKLELEQMTDIM